MSNIFDLRLYCKETYEVLLVNLMTFISFTLIAWSYFYRFKVFLFIYTSFLKAYTFVKIVINIGNFLSNYLKNSISKNLVLTKTVELKNGFVDGQVSLIDRTQYWLNG